MLTERSASARVWYERVYDLLLPWLKDPCECQAISRRLLAYYVEYDLNKHLLEEELTVDEKTFEAIKSALLRLKAHEPIQYILGEAPFLGHTLYVSPDVLIPRPETEEMINALLQENDLTHARVLDIGTGSGCIALAIKKAFPNATVDALDISERALAVAQKNGISLGVEITWHCLDFLKEGLPNKQWDVIVSNPPYIPEKEKASMSKHVVAHEPSLALFVPDHNPYLFYEKIAKEATTHLSDKGKVYLEFHHLSATDIKAVFRKHGFDHIRVSRDLQGKERWLVSEV